MSVKVEDEGFEDDVSLSPSSPGRDDDDGIKPEDRDISMGVEDDDDDGYEDANDLDLSGIGSKVWLVRLPKFLMERWKKVDSLSGQELGKVRIRNPQGDEPWKVKLMLNETRENADIPHEYDVNLVKQVVDNTFVFTEQDIQDHKRRANGTQQNNKPASAGPSRNNNNNTNSNNNSNNGNHRYTPYVKTVSKKTALVGTACHECIVTPSLRDKNYSRVVRQRKVMESISSRPKVTLLNEVPGVAAGSLKGPSTMFIRAQKTMAQKGEGKATRIPKNELLDLLFRLFEEYDYWSMKGLRERTKQPEVYLKEVLESMATLIKKGPYSMKYCLKPEFKRIREQGGSLSSTLAMDESADAADQSAEASASQSQDQDDDDMEMETIM